MFAGTVILYCYPVAQTLGVCLNSYVRSVGEGRGKEWKTDGMDRSIVRSNKSSELGSISQQG